MFRQYPYGSISSSKIEDFLRRIHIEKLKAPASSNAIFFGGTEDIVMEISDMELRLLQWSVFHVNRISLENQHYLMRAKTASTLDLK